MKGKGSVVLRLVIGCGVLVLLAAASAGWMVWRRPLTVDARISRLALKRAGLRAATVTTPSGSMSFFEGGAGPPMVLVHGAGDQAGAWARVVPQLASDYRLLIPDLPGHWRSDPRDGPIGIDQILVGLAALIHARCPRERVTLVGNSLGAWVSMLWAIEHQDRVACVVAVNGGPLVQANPKVNLFPQTREEARATMAGLTGPSSPPIPGWVLDDIVRHSNHGPAARLAATASTMAAFLLDGRLDQLEVPVELVWGEADQLMTVEYADRMLGQLPHARLHLVAGCGHVPQRECPGRFVTALRSALTPPPESAAPAEVEP
jgi:pimeloyl-ACP methyl ester carboxylesterase